MLLASMILLLGFQAWAEPQPASLFVADADSLQFTLSGKLFGEAPEVALPGALVSSTEGLKGCILLADSPVLENCGHLEILSVHRWEGNSITFVPGVKVSEESKDLFIFVMDGEGNHSLPIGPLPVVNGRPSVDPKATGLEAGSFTVDAENDVQVLQPVGQKAEAPGQPGQPITGG